MSVVCFEFDTFPDDLLMLCTSISIPVGHLGLYGKYTLGTHLFPGRRFESVCKITCKHVQYSNRVIAVDVNLKMATAAILDVVGSKM